MSDDAVSNGAKRADRDGSGRFMVGHSLPGPGNPRLRHASALQQAIAFAADPTELVAVLDTMKKLALAGDSTAARLWLDRTCGTSRASAPAEALSIDMDGVDLQTVSGLDLLSSRALAAHVVGDIDDTQARTVCDLIEARVSLLKATVLEQRIDALEKRK